MTRNSHPPEPVHVTGTSHGEELPLREGREPGRTLRQPYRSARDATGINAEDMQPIHPDMPHIPPA